MDRRDPPKDPGLPKWEEFNKLTPEEQYACIQKIVKYTKEKLDWLSGYGASEAERERAYKHGWRGGPISFHDKDPWKGLNMIFENNKEIKND
jgi:hypothetical protein